MYNWVGVVDFLQKHFETDEMEKKQWALEKKQLAEKVALLEAQLAAGEVLNLDLMKRIQILQHCLRQQRRNRPSAHVNVQAKLWALQQSTKVAKKNDEHTRFLERILTEAGISKSDIHSKQIVEESVIYNQDTPVNQLTGHLDQVRGIYYEPKSKSLVSVSEDCLIKFWDTSKLDKRQYQVQSQLTVRENTGQLMTVTGTGEDDANSLVFTGGIQGIIKVWQPTKESIQKSSCLRGEWLNYKQEAAETVIWQLAYLNDSLLSSSSSSQIRLYSLAYEYKQSQIVSVTEKLLNTFTHKNNLANSLNDPTSVCWIDAHTFINGYSNLNALTRWDIKTAAITSTLKYTLPNKLQPQNGQSNRILYNPHLNQIVSAHQDGYVRAFDPGSNKLIASLEHKDSVSCMAIPTKSPFQLFSGSHSGSICMWDVRKHQMLKEIKNVHQRKYDECVQAVILIEQKELLLSGGADSLIKAFKY